MTSLQDSRSAEDGGSHDTGMGYDPQLTRTALMQSTHFAHCDA